MGYWSGLRLAVGLATNMSRLKFAFGLTLLFLFVVTPGLSALSNCKSQTIQGIEPKELSDAWGTGGHLNILMAKSYTFQDGYLVGWQMYNKINSDSYFVDVFRPVAGEQSTFDLVHSTEVGSTTAGNKTVLVASAFKVQTGDYIGVHTDGSGSFGLAMELSGVSSVDWPVANEATFSSHFVTNKRVSVSNVVGRKVALRAIVASDALKETICDQYFVKLPNPSTILTKSFYSQMSRCLSECSFRCVQTASCNGFSFSKTTNACKLYLAVKTLAQQPTQEEIIFVDVHVQ